MPDLSRLDRCMQISMISTATETDLRYEEQELQSHKANYGNEGAPCALPLEGISATFTTNIPASAGGHEEVSKKGKRYFMSRRRWSM